MVQSPQRIVTGLPLHMPKVDFGQFGLGHIRAENNLTNPENERSFDCLYVRRADNGSGDIIFALDTLQQRSVNRFTAIPISIDTIKRVNKLGKDDKQPEGLIFGDFYNKTTVHDFDDDAGGSDGNASDKDFKHDQAYEQVFEEEAAKENRFIDKLEPVPPNELLQKWKHKANILTTIMMMTVMIVMMMMTATPMMMTIYQLCNQATISIQTLMKMK